MTKIKLLIVTLAIASRVIAAEPVAPDPKLTPGVKTDIVDVCKTKWGKDHRFVTQKMKEFVFAEYHVTAAQRHVVVKGKKKARYEIDHLISRELGGADDVKNLWPESYYGPWNAHDKDRIENKLHSLVCNGTITLSDAQAMIRTDWVAAYKRFIPAK